MVQVTEVAPPAVHAAWPLLPQLGARHWLLLLCAAQASALAWCMAKRNAHMAGRAKKRE